MSEFIKRMAHVALRVPDLEASVAWATTVMGLRESERHDGDLVPDPRERATTRSSTSRPTDRRSTTSRWRLTTWQSLERLLERVKEHGLEVVSEAVEERGLQITRFASGARRVTSSRSSPAWTRTSRAYTGLGVRPRKFGHPTITCDDTYAARDLMQDVLGFRLSDELGPGILIFLRCNVDHHGMGIQKGPPGINHYAWNVESLATLGELGDVLAENGGRFIWGPGRHGAGNNLFTYHFDPAGSIVEYYADMQQVLDEGTYVPRHWSLEDPRGPNLWGPGVPEELLEAYTPLA